MPEEELDESTKYLLAQVFKSRSLSPQSTLNLKPGKETKYKKITRDDGQTHVYEVMLDHQGKLDIHNSTGIFPERHRESQQWNTYQTLNQTLFESGKGRFMKLMSGTSKPKSRSNSNSKESFGKRADVTTHLDQNELYMRKTPSYQMRSTLSRPAHSPKQRNLLSLVPLRTHDKESSHTGSFDRSESRPNLNLQMNEPPVIAPNSRVVHHKRSSMKLNSSNIRIEEQKLDPYKDLQVATHFQHNNPYEVTDAEGEGDHSSPHGHIARYSASNDGSKSPAGAASPM